jgi:penicillin-binding protein 2B
LNGKKVNEAGALVDKYKMNYDVLGDGTTIKDQYPKAAEAAGEEQHIYLLTEDKDKLTMPDLTGRSKRDVMEVCSILQTDCTYTGSGYVTSQQQSANSPYGYSFFFEPVKIEESAEEAVETVVEQ